MPWPTDARRPAGSGPLAAGGGSSSSARRARRRVASTLASPVTVSTRAMITSDSPALTCGTGTGPTLVTPEERSASLNFRVSPDFRREFKVYAAAHDLKLSELLQRSFETYRQAQGG